MDYRQAYESPMPLTEMRPRLGRRLLDALSFESVQLRDQAARCYVTTVGLLLHYADLHGDGWMRRIPGITRREENRLAEALETFWMARALNRRKKFTKKDHADIVKSPPRVYGLARPNQKADR